MVFIVFGYIHSKKSKRVFITNSCILLYTYLFYIKVAAVKKLGHLRFLIV